MRVLTGQVGGISKTAVESTAGEADSNMHRGRKVQFNNALRKACSFFAGGCRTIGRQVRRFRDYCVVKHPVVPSPQIINATKLPWFETKLEGTELHWFKTFREGAIDQLLNCFEEHPPENPGAEFPEVKKTVIENFGKDFDGRYQTGRLNIEKKIPSVSINLYKALASTTIRPGVDLNSKKYDAYFENLVFHFQNRSADRERQLEGWTRLPRSMPISSQKKLDMKTGSKSVSNVRSTSYFFEKKKT